MAVNLVASAADRDMVLSVFLDSLSGVVGNGDGDGVVWCGVV